MIKKIFSLCSLLAISCSAVCVNSLTSCSSGATDEEAAYAVSFMTLANFASGQKRFLIRNNSGRFFFINSDGAPTDNLPVYSNEIIVQGNIEVDGTLFAANIIYKSNESTRPDGLPTEATIEVSLLNTEEMANAALIAAVAANVGDNAEIKGEPIVLAINFDSGLGTMQCTFETDVNYATDDGNIYIGRDTIEYDQPVNFTVISSLLEAE